MAKSARIYRNRLTSTSLTSFKLDQKENKKERKMSVRDTL